MGEDRGGPSQSYPRATGGGRLLPPAFQGSSKVYLLKQSGNVLPPGRKCCSWELAG